MCRVYNYRAVLLIDRTNRRCGCLRYLSSRLPWFPLHLSHTGPNTNRKQCTTRSCRLHQWRMALSSRSSWGVFVEPGSSGRVRNESGKNGTRIMSRRNAGLFTLRAIASSYLWTSELRHTRNLNKLTKQFYWPCQKSTLDPHLIIWLNLHRYSLAQQPMQRKCSSHNLEEFISYL